MHRNQKRRVENSKSIKLHCLFFCRIKNFPASASDSEEDIPYSEEEEIGIDEEEDMEDIDEYGPDLYKDEEDRKR